MPEASSRSSTQSKGKEFVVVIDIQYTVFIFKCLYLKLK